jgi:ribosomal protein L13E
MDKQDLKSLLGKISARFDKNLPKPMLVYGRRLAPAQGFSRGELEQAGLDDETAAQLGIAVDSSRMSSLGNNVTALKQFLKG